MRGIDWRGRWGVFPTPNDHAGMPKLKKRHFSAKNRPKFAFFCYIHGSIGSFMRGIDWRGRWGAFSTPNDHAGMPKLEKPHFLAKNLPKFAFFCEFPYTYRKFYARNRLAGSLGCVSHTKRLRRDAKTRKIAFFSQKSPKSSIFLRITYTYRKFYAINRLAGSLGCVSHIKRPRRDAETQKKAFFSQKSTKIAQNLHFFCEFPYTCRKFYARN